LLLLASLLAPATAAGQLRYITSLDLREQFNSDVQAGVISEPGVPEQDPQWDFVTEIEPTLRLYYNTSRHNLSLRYALLFQVYARTMDAQEDRNLLGYRNALLTGYGYLIQRGTELAIQNRLAQGTEQAMVSGYMSGTTPRAGYHTTGSSFVTDSLIIGLAHEFNARWALISQVQGDVYLAYDRFIDDDNRIIPPPWNFGVAVNESLRRNFGVGVLRVDASYGWVRQYYDPEVIPFRGAFPETLDTMMASLLLGWEQRLNEQWDYRLGLGADVRVLEEYEIVGQCAVVGNVPTCRAVNRGYGEPGWGPAAEAMLRFTWQHWLGATLGYTHRTQRYIENRVGVAAEADEVGASFFAYLEKWHFEAHGAFRYMRISSQQLGAETETGTKLGRVHLGVAYLITPGVSIDLSYDYEAAEDAVSYQWQDPAATTGPVAMEPTNYSYMRHLVTLGVSLAWPPPPPQDLRFMRRESEYEPVFSREFGGAAENQSQPGNLTDPDQVENQADDSPDADGLDPDQEQELEQEGMDQDGLDRANQGMDRDQ